MTEPYISKPPTTAIVRAGNLISEGVRRFLTAREPLLPSMWQYEAPVEAVLLFNAAIRHLEALTLMARHDLVLFPSSAVVARAALDASIRVMWLLQPIDAMQREARWLAHIKEEEHSRTRAIRLVQKLGGDGGPIASHLEALRRFRESVEDALPAGTAVPTSVPDVRTILAGFDEESKYLLYIELSQFTHPTHVTSSLYRAHLGQFKQLGEFISPSMWRFLFASAWPAFATAAKMLFLRVASHGNAFGDESFSGTVWEAINQIEDDENAGASDLTRR